MPKFLYAIIVISLLLTSCGQASEAKVATLVARSLQETISASKEQGRNISAFEITPSVMSTDNAQIPTFTPKPTSTPRPTPKPTSPVVFNHDTQTINQAILDSPRGKLYSFPKITFIKISASKKVENRTANNDNTFIIINLTMENPGTEVAEYGDVGFIAFDDDGVSHDPSYGPDCTLNSYVDVLPGGVLKGCIVFEVPDTGHVKIAYAPYKNNQFGEGRCLIWEVKYQSQPNQLVIVPSIRIYPQSPYKPQFVDALAFIFPFKIIGEMVNTSDRAISNIKVEITTYDPDGNIIETIDGVNWQEIVFPGEKVIYWAGLGAESWNSTNVSLSINAEMTEPTAITGAYRDFTMSNFTLQPNTNGWLQMVGDIKNIGKKSCMGLGIHVIAYDKDGNIIGYEQATAGYNQNDIKPGDSVPIEGSMRIEEPNSLSAVDHFEFIYSGTESLAQ